ncbi:MAG TPA: carotenoid biosynthesis protein [Gemmatimonas sp.]|uniref:carotenoid biosynthesis protein n=1 Tax=Gemmatimonas sp. TaxID=1962908 RepID=UPI002ED82711
MNTSTPLFRVAVFALIAHAVLSAFSAFAFATFLVPPYPEWLQTPTNQRVMALGYTFGGQTTVVLGAVAGLAFLAHAIGKRSALITFAVAFVLSLSSELAGTATGFPFGAYGYTDQLGYKIAGLVPFNIPTSWFYMLVASLAICGRTMAARDDNATKWWWALIGGLVLTAWDVSMDPAMVKTRHWLWLGGDLSQASALQQFIGTPFFFGMPLTNWLGWILTGVLVARAMLAIVPPSVWARQVSPSNLPLALYAVNGLLPLAICFAQDMVLAGVLGTIAMGVPLVLALRRSEGTFRAGAPTVA